MKSYLIIFLLLTTNLIFAQEMDKSEETIKLNDNFSFQLKQITIEEYTERKKQSVNLQHKPYKAVTDILKAQKMLGKRLKVIDRKEDGADFGYREYEITFKDKTKEHLDSDYGFIAYFPQLEILLFEGGHSTDHSFDLNNNNSDTTYIGNPYYHSISPDKQFRLNGFYDGQDCVVYFLEKWNKLKKQYEFIGYFPRYSNNSFVFCYVGSLFWTDKNKVMFTNLGGKYEMEIVENR